MMKWSLVALALPLAACATFGSTPEYRVTGVGAVSDVTECLTDEITDEGWTVTGGTESGIVRGEAGTNWVQATVQPQQEISAAGYLLEVSTSNTEAARDLAADLVENCGSGTTS